MAITNGLTSLAIMKSRFGITDATDDAHLERAVEAASRRVESYCNRERFWVDAVVTTREFFATDGRSTKVPVGISTTTELVVKTDENADGTFERTLTINTDFLLRPADAARRVPVWPFNEIWLADNYLFPTPSNGRPGVQVTAKFGWPAVPDDVEEACVILAHRLWKRKETSTGVIGFDGFGATVRLSRTDPDVVELLEPYVVHGLA